jgi:hypothetical protein
MYDMDEFIEKMINEVPSDLKMSPRDHNTPLRILTIDGGGMKGMNTIAMLREIQNRCNLPINELFDLIGGTSAGGCAAIYIVQRLEKALDIIFERLDALSNDVMSTSNIIRLLFTGQRISQRAVDHFHKTQLKKLEVSDKELLRRPTTSVDNNKGYQHVPHMFCMMLEHNKRRDDWSPYVSRNYSQSSPLVSAGSDHMSVSDTLVGCTAAPTYFRPLKNGDGQVYVDAGVNNLANPSIQGLQEVLTLWPGRKIGAFVSLGCGKSCIEKSFTHGHLDYWLPMILKLIAAPIAPHRQMKSLIKQLIPDLQYFRLEPPTGDFEIDESRTTELDKMCSITRDYIRKKDAKIDRICIRLLLLTRAPHLLHKFETLLESSSDPVCVKKVLSILVARLVTYPSLQRPSSRM